MATHKAWGEPGGNGQGGKEGQCCQLHGVVVGNPCVVVCFRVFQCTMQKLSVRLTVDDVGKTTDGLDYFFM
jgi:hypothetical protein